MLRMERHQYSTPSSTSSPMTTMTITALKTISATESCMKDAIVEKTRRDYDFGIIGRRRDGAGGRKEEEEQRRREEEEQDEKDEKRKEEEG